MKSLTLFITLISLAFACNKPASTVTETEEVEKPEEVKEVVQESQEPKRQLRHVVIFKFKETATPADIKSVEEAFAALPGKIPQIKGFEFGTNNSPEGLDKGFTHCFLLSFDSEEDRAIYLPHPDHKEFGKILGPFLEDVLVLDYWTAE